MPKFADYTKFAAPHCPNLPTIVFARAMLSAAREYFTLTQAWEEVITVHLREGRAEYAIPEPWENAMLDTVLETSIEGESYYKRDIKIIGKTKVTVSPVPKKDMELKLKISLKPSIDSQEMPRELFDEHFEGLIAGAVWQIKRTRGDWYDPQGAQEHRAEFMAFVDQKRIQMMQGYANNILNIESF